MLNVGFEHLENDVRPLDGPFSVVSKPVLSDKVLFPALFEIYKTQEENNQHLVLQNLVLQ